jgi:pantoate--beta-alanine ligase
LERFESADDVRARVAGWRASGDTVALVPTMGNAHQGHLSLVELAGQQADHVVVSVFVNPTQFSPNEDFSDYPRTLEADADSLSAVSADLMFAPSVETMYPFGLDHATTVLVPGLSDELCGAHRPGHFQGVTSVVCRLLNICSPDIAVFGQKDYQQFVILRRMVADLQLSVRLIAGPTQRESNGLAKSSRNGFLNASQQETAAVIYRTLTDVHSALRDGKRDFTALEKRAMDAIAAAGLEPEYVAVRTADDLASPDSASRSLAVLAAARLGKVRLIDNLVVSLQGN